MIPDFYLRSQTLCSLILSSKKLPDFEFTNLPSLFGGAAVEYPHIAAFLPLHLLFGLASVTHSRGARALIRLRTPFPKTNDNVYGSLYVSGAKYILYIQFKFILPQHNLSVAMNIILKPRVPTFSSHDTLTYPEGRLRAARIRPASGALWSLTYCLRVSELPPLPAPSVVCRLHT